MEKPWLEYEGQSSQDLIARHQTHRVDSILCALEWAIQAKEQQAGALTPEESLVLSLMALDREVQNGGFDQFFVNSSSQYAPVIVQNLVQIGAAHTAQLAEQALTARDDEDALNALDRQYYDNYELEDKLWAFVYQHQDAIQVPGKQ